VETAEERLHSFVRDIGQGTPFEIVLRGHLYVEWELLASLNIALPHPEVADLSRLPFRHTVSLVAAHGLMAADDQGGFKRLNELRNNLAHRLEVSITENDEQSLVNAIGPRHRERLEQLRAYNGQVFPNDLRNVLAVMCFVLQEDRAAYRERRHRDREQAPRLYKGL
jgi:hypothetical protein